MMFTTIQDTNHQAKGQSTFEQLIAAEVDRHLTILRKTENQVDANLRRTKRLSQSVLAKGFNSCADASIVSNAN